MSHFEKVKGYITDLGYSIVSEVESEELVIIEDEAKGIKNMVIDCEDPILIIEQVIFEVKNETLDMFKQLLIKNGDIIHGAFILDPSGTKVLFRDTLQLENLDLNEIEASINSLTILLNEYFQELIDFAE